MLVKQGVIVTGSIQNRIQALPECSQIKMGVKELFWQMQKLSLLHTSSFWNDSRLMKL